MNCDLCILLSYMLRILCQYDSKLAEQPGQKDAVTADQRALLTLQKANAKTQQKYKWSYEGQTGPGHWSKNFPQCGGRRQSPINIMTSHLHHVTWLPQFEFINYDKLSGDGMTPAFLHLRNNGHTASMTIDDDVYLRGSNLGELYKAVEIHFHWGPDNGIGSEHVLDDHHHPLEVHIVHYNTKYKTLSEAKQQPDGLAVIGVFADISEEKNPAFELIAMALDQVTEYNQRTIITGLRPIEMLPNDTTKYYHYAGSLTTPPCYESVAWYIMHEGIKITQDQINRLRHLKEHVDEDHKPRKPHPTLKPIEELKINIPNNKTEHSLSKLDPHANMVSYIRYNFRPCQPLYERKVYCSHPALVKYSSYLQEFSVGDIAVNHHVSNLGDHDLSKALLQDTGTGFRSIGSSLSRHPHDGHTLGSTLNVHSHGNNLPSHNDLSLHNNLPSNDYPQPRKMEIDFNGHNLKHNRIKDALQGNPDTFPNEVLPKNLQDILTNNHIPDFNHKLQQEDIYKIFGNIFLRQAQILSAQKTTDSKVDTKLFAEPEMKEYSNPVYTVNKIQSTVQHQGGKHNPHSKTEPQQHLIQNSSKHIDNSQDHTASKYHEDVTNLHNQEAIKHHPQGTPKTLKHAESAVRQSNKEILPVNKMNNKNSGLSYDLAADRRNTYSARKRNKLLNGRFHYSARKPSYQQQSGEVSRHYAGSTLNEKKKFGRFISKPSKHYGRLEEKPKAKTDVSNSEQKHQRTEKMLSANSFDVMESERTGKSQKDQAAFKTPTSKVGGSAGFGAKHLSTISVKTLGLQKPSAFEERVNAGLSNLRTESVTTTEITTQSTPQVQTASVPTSPATETPKTVTTTSQPYRPVRTTLGNGKIRFPIQRERNATSIPIRNMLDGHNNMLSMLTNPPPSKDQKPYLPL